MKEAEAGQWMERWVPPVWGEWERPFPISFQWWCDLPFLRIFGCLFIDRCVVFVWLCLNYVHMFYYCLRLFYQFCKMMFTFMQSF